MKKKLILLAPLLAAWGGVAEALISVAQARADFQQKLDAAVAACVQEVRAQGGEAFDAFGTVIYEGDDDNGHYIFRTTFSTYGTDYGRFLFQKCRRSSPLLAPAPQTTPQ